MKRVRAVLLLMVFASLAHARAEAPGETLHFSLDRSGSVPLHFDIELDQATGRGTYRESTAAPPAGAAGMETVSAPAERPLQVAAPVLKKLFAAVPPVRSHRCESHTHGIAQTGTKTIRYAQDDRAVECSYNYSDDDRLNTATDLLVAISETMRYGGRLAQKLRFDRLGLDTEMDSLQAAVTDGRAIELGNIAGVLQAIQADDQVMDRVRRKAARLLASAGVPQGQPEAGADVRER